MSKIKTVFVCQNCGLNSAKWQGKCTSCGEWNSFVEEVVYEKKSKAALPDSMMSLETVSLGDYSVSEQSRIQLPDSEMNRIIGGGLVPGSMVLIGGEPGIGKSTLLLQIALKYDENKVLYVSGEESINQIKLRAKRLNLSNPNCHLFAETNLEMILRITEQLKPAMLIVDSIQTLYTNAIDNTAGSVTQIRECTAGLMQLAKKNNVPVFLVGHITKEGYIAGPKLLEHMVDTVLYFEGDRNYDYRILRTIKNRFGSVSDLGIYEMLEEGLREVKNPSELLMSHRDMELSGISIAASIEGIRPMLIELHALVSPSYYGTPQRNTTGFDSRRLSMLLAVLEKRCGMKISNQDVFINIAGGLKLQDPSIDMGVVAALSSSFFDTSISNSYCFSGEVGLSGEIRPVRQLANRIAEAEKLGFQKIFISSYNNTTLSKSFKIQVVKINTVQELLRKLIS